MKCVILAFDALEYNFVQDFNLVNLKQKEYGKVIIPDDCFVKVKTDYLEESLLEPQTPLVWFSFLTGKLPSEVGFSPIRWKSRVLNMISSRSGWHTKILLANVIINKIGMRDKLERFLNRRFGQRRSTVRDYNVKTILDLTEKSYAINVPLYTKKWKGWGYGVDPADFKDFDEFVNAVLKKHSARFDEYNMRTLRFLEQNREWDLLMAYFYVLDPFGELCFGDIKELSNMYSRVDDFVGEVKKRLDDSFVLIVSDHGVQRLENTHFGKHSNYAFYSTNIPLHLKNPKITDFYHFIKRMLSTNSRSFQ